MGMACQSDSLDGSVSRLTRVNSVWVRFARFPLDKAEQLLKRLALSWACKDMELDNLDTVLYIQFNYCKYKLRKWLVG